MIQMAVPTGVPPGGVVQVVVNGMMISVQVPPDRLPGGVVTVQLPPQPQAMQAASLPRAIQVAVPPGCPLGSTMQVAANGMTISVQVPPGSVPGSTFTIAAAMPPQSAPAPVMAQAPAPVVLQSPAPVTATMMTTPVPALSVEMHDVTIDTTTPLAPPSQPRAETSAAELALRRLTPNVQVIDADMARRIFTLLDADASGEIAFDGLEHGVDRNVGIKQFLDKSDNQTDDTPLPDRPRSTATLPEQPIRTTIARSPRMELFSSDRPRSTEYGNEAAQSAYAAQLQGTALSQNGTCATQWCIRRARVLHTLPSATAYCCYTCAISGGHSHDPERCDALEATAANARTKAASPPTQPAPRGQPPPAAPSAILRSPHQLNQLNHSPP